MNIFDEASKAMTARFGKDNFFTLITMNENRPAFRTVNAYYEDGSFYVVTNAISNKMKQIALNPNVILCTDWFAANGTGENIGHVLGEHNTTLMAKIREAFSEWYTHGDVNENDPNTCILRVRLTDALVYKDSKEYKIDFVSMTA